MKKGLSYLAIISFACLLTGTASAQQTKQTELTEPKAPTMMGKKPEPAKTENIKEPVVSAPVAAKDIPATFKENSNSTVPKLTKANESQSLQPGTAKPVAIDPATDRTIPAALAKKQAEQYPETPAAVGKPPVMNMTPPAASKTPEPVSLKPAVQKN